MATARKSCAAIFQSTEVNNVLVETEERKYVVSLRNWHFAIIYCDMLTPYREPVQIQHCTFYHYNLFIHTSTLKYSETHHEFV